MKLFTSLLIFALISSTFSAQLCDGSISGSSYNECKNYALPEGQNYKYCCYLHASAVIQEKKEVINSCGPITEEQYKNIDELCAQEKKRMEEQGAKDVVVELDCGQKTTPVPASTGGYIQSSILALLFLLFN